MTNLNIVKLYYRLAVFFPLEAFIAPIVVLFYLDYTNVTFLEYSSFISATILLSISLEIPMGFVSDHIGHRRALLLGDLLYVTGLICLVVLKGVPALLFAAIFMSFGGSLSSGNLHSIGYKAFAENGKKDEFSGFIAQISSLSILVFSLYSLAGGWLADINIVFPMLMDIGALIIKICIGFIIFIIIWPAEFNETEMATKYSSFAWNKEKFHSLLNVILQKKFILTIILSGLCFALLRTSLNFYQPILEIFGWKGKDLGMLFASGCIISALVSHNISKKLMKKLSLSFGYKIFILGVFVSAFFFAISTFVESLFVLGFIIHQIIRVVVPSITAGEVQNSMPDKFPLRTTVVSVGFFTNAFLGSLFISITGYMVDSYGSFQEILLGTHIFTFIILLISCLILKRKKLNY